MKSASPLLCTCTLTEFCSTSQLFPPFILASSKSSSIPMTSPLLATRTPWLRGSRVDIKLGTSWRYEVRPSAAGGSRPPATTVKLLLDPDGRLRPPY